MDKIKEPVQSEKYKLEKIKVHMGKLEYIFMNIIKL